VRTRAEHLAWCKERALEYVDANQLQEAVTSMLSDLTKHPDTEKSGGGPFVLLGIAALMANDPHEVRRFITGFN
jgi:hypothetical protein